MDPSSGGPCQGIRNSIPEMSKLGVENEVVSLDDLSAPFLSKDKFPIHALGPANNPWAYSSKLVPWLLENFPRFDVVILHGLWLYTGVAVRKAVEEYSNQVLHGSREKIPKLYVMPHGMLDPYFQRARGRKLKAIRNWFYWKLIEKKLISTADGILFTCEAELQLAKETFYPYRPKREINIGYGISEPPPYLPAMKEAFIERCPDLRGRPYLLFLSRIHEKKGVDLLLKAYKEVFGGKKGDQRTGDTKDVNPVLIVAGPGMDTSFGKEIRQIATSETETETDVFFPGMLTGDAKWGAFYGCEAFVLPSHQENFGIAVVEALACGKPVLISNQVNIWREIEIEGAGLISNDTQQGTSDLLRLYKNLTFSEKQKMGLNAKHTFEKYFAIGPAAKHMLEAVKN